MPGWPIRCTRNALGVAKENRGAIVNPKHCIPADEYMLLAWQAIGAAGAGPVAWVLVSSAGARLASFEAWNPNGDNTLRPTCSRTSTGLFVVTYAASYPDETGTSTPLVLLAGDPAVQSATKNIIANCSLAGNVVTVQVTTAHTNALTDANFLLKVF